MIDVWMLWHFLTRRQQEELWNILVNKWISWGEMTSEGYLQDVAAKKGKHDITNKRLCDKVERRKLKD